MEQWNDGILGTFVFHIETPRRLSPPQGEAPTSDHLMISLKPAMGSIRVPCLRHGKGIDAIYVPFY
jgi:hypothetical protein